MTERSAFNFDKTMPESTSQNGASSRSPNRYDLALSNSQSMHVRLDCLDRSQFLAQDLFMTADEKLSSLLKEIEQDLASYRYPATEQKDLFTSLELDLLYELTRDARNALHDPEDEVQAGSWADAIIKLDNKLTKLFRQRRQ